MKLSSLDLNLLVALNALIEEASVSRAAGRLGVTQPAVSASLRRLRVIFGDELLVRTARGMTLSARAQQLQPALREVLARIQGLFDEGGQFDPSKLSRTFFIGLNDYASLVILPEILSDVRRAAPGLNIVMQPCKNIESAREDLENGRLDFALGIGDARTLPGSLMTLRLFDDPFVTVMRRGHRLSRGELTFQRYLEAEHMVVSPQGHERGIIDDLLALRGLHRRVSLVVPHFAVAVRIVSESDVMSTLPSRIVDLYRGIYPVSVTEPPLKVPASNISLAWHARMQESPAHVWLRDVFARVWKRTGRPGRKADI